MAANPRSKAQRETAARVREYRAGRGYKSVLPESYKTRARTAYQATLDQLAAKNPSELSQAEKKRLAQAASYGAHGRKAYLKYDTTALRSLWYHNKR